MSAKTAPFSAVAASVATLGGNWAGAINSEGSEGSRPPEKFSELSPDVQTIYQKAAAFLRNPAAF
eukprot:8391978-Pyramimonas_sp.AAC.1